MKRCSSEMSFSAKPERPEKKMKSTYMGDPRLLPRVQQYLEAHRDKKVVDLAAMADELQSKYGEYGRKKKAAFKKTVEKAYEHFLRSNRQSSAKENPRKRQADDRDVGESGDDSPEFSDDNQEYTTYENTNAMNSLMRNFYSKPGSRPGSRLGSRPPSQPGSGANTPIGGRSPYRPTESDSTPTPLFTVDRTGNKNLKDSLTTKTKTPTSSPKPKAKHTQGVGLASHKQEARSVGLIDLVSDSEEDTPSLGSRPQNNMLMSKSEGSLRKEGESRLHETSDSQTEKISAAEGLEPKKGTPTLNTKPKPGDTVGSRSTVKKRRRQDAEDKKKGPEVSQSKFTFADVGGNDKMLAEVCKLLVHMKHPEVYRQLGVTPPRGLLLHGPPGCGKTLLAHAIAGELELPFLKVAATEVVSGVSGESEEKVRDTFEKAMSSAPCVLFLDEIDAITQKRENASKDMERRIVSQLLTCMDELNSCEAGHVLVIGATNRPDSLDPALRRAGRFDREVSLGIPDQAARQRILAVLCRPLRLAADMDLAALARLTPGYVGADLMSLAREAAITAVNRVFKALQTSTKITEEGDSQVKCPTVGTGQVTTTNPDTPSVTPVVTSNSTPIPAHSNHIETETDHAVIENCDVEMTEVTPINSQSEEQDTPLPPTASEEQLTHSESSSQAVPVQAEVGECSKQEEMGQVMAQESELTAHDTALTNGEVENRTVESGVEEAQADDNAKQENAFLKGLQQSTKKDTEDDQDLATVLGWLKDQPPLTEEQLENLWIEMSDFEAAARFVQPSAKREGFATTPDVTWSDIGALHEVRDELQMAILAPVRHPEQFAALGLTSPPGVLLAGPPGCGKTLLAKAVANESGINFISVKGPELLNMYVGESERAVRQVFQRARNSAPCVIFFDELDALCPRRSDGGEGGSSVRVVNQLLTEMDGLEDRKQVFIMGATNRPDIIDPAVLRPGRLDKTLYVGLPGASDRHDILRTLTKNGSKPRLMPDVDLATVAADSRCEGYTGADLAALVREAAVTALRQFMVTPHKDGEATVVGCSHFDAAFNKIKPSVSEKERLKYEKMNHRLRPS